MSTLRMIRSFFICDRLFSLIIFADHIFLASLLMLYCDLFYLLNLDRTIAYYCILLPFVIFFFLTI